MEPGDAIEDLIDKTYFPSWPPLRDAHGKRPRSYRYSRNNAAALDLLAFTNLHDSVDIHRHDAGGTDEWWTVDINGRGCNRDQEQYDMHGEGKTLAMAVCQAVLHFDIEATETRSEDCLASPLADPARS